MAESMVSLALENLAAFIKAEVGALGSLPEDVEDLKMELGTIKASLKDAEKKAEEDETINEWLMQVQTIAYDIEDLVDGFLLLKLQQKQSSQHSYQQVIWMISKIKRWLGKAVVCVSQLKPKHELSSKIKEIKTSVIEINNRKERYQFCTTAEEVRDPKHPFSHLLEDSEVVGIEDRKKKLSQSMNLQLENRCVIAVVGMGGLGKTTLVRKLYDEFIQNKSFDVHAWVPVGQSYKYRDLLMTIYKQVHMDSSLKVDASEEDIISELRNHLMSTRYIVIFDDVWDRELWKLVKYALPPNNMGSRILVTTRENKIAQGWEASLYYLEPLTREAAWDLYTHKIFGERHCPQDLEELARDMVAKCNGLPLAIVAIAGLLNSKKKVPFEWNKLRNSIGTELGGNLRFKSDKRILLLSYHELPYYLKSCFLYLAMFPEGFSINGKKLVRLWIAEGFIQNQKGKTLEWIAEEYLDELVDSNLIEVDVQNKFRLCNSTKQDISYKVHDILREMIIIPKSNNLGFSLHLAKESEFCSGKRFRRLGIDQNFANKCDLEDFISSSTRTILSFSNLIIFSEPYLNSPESPLRVARLLKVLDLEKAQIDNAPEELGNLQHLKYLSFRHTNIRALPKSIGNLWNLQTLDLKFSLIVELPKELARCCKLRHLLAYPRESESGNLKTKAVKIQDGVLEKFKDLQKLASVEASTASIVNGLQHLKHLRSLRITMLRDEHGKRLCHAIEEMQHLRSLRIGTMSYIEILDVQHISTPPPYLERLYLHGLLEKLPDWIAKLNNLAILSFFSSRLEKDPLNILQGLPKLEELTLDDAFVGEKLDFRDSGFSKLATLNLFQLYNLKSIDGPLPALKVGDVHGCPKLQIQAQRIEEVLMHKRNLLRRFQVSLRLTKAAYSFREVVERHDQQ